MSQSQRRATHLDGLEKPFLSLVSELPEAVSEADLDGLGVGGLDDEEPVLTGREPRVSRRREARGRRRRGRRPGRAFDRNEDTRFRAEGANDVRSRFQICEH